MSSAFHIHIGGAGVMIGDMLWKLYEKEYNETTQKKYIYDQVDGNYHPLALFADLDDRMIHEVQRNKYIKFKKNSFLNGKEDTSNIYSRGIYTVGKNFIRQQVETMDRLDQFLITTSISGGTGSGFSTLLTSRLSQDYGIKVKKNGFILFPSSEMSNNILEIYNATFSIYMTRYLFDNIIMFDNQSMYNVIDQQLDLDYLDYSHLNNLIAQIISSYTGLKRFNNIDNSKFFQNMCPYPSLHYFIPSYGRMSSINNYTRKQQNQTEFIKYLTQKECKLYQCPVNPEHLSTTLLFRQKEQNHFYGKFDVTLQNLEHFYHQSPRVFQCTSSNYQILSELAEMNKTEYSSQMMLQLLVDLTCQEESSINFMLNELLPGHTNLKDLVKVNLLKIENIYFIQKKNIVILQKHLILKIKVILILNFEFIQKNEKLQVLINVYPKRTSVWKYQLILD